MLPNVLTAALLLSLVSCGSEASGQTETQAPVPGRILHSVHESFGVHGHKGDYKSYHIIL